MSTSTLSAHSGKLKSQIVSYEQLAAMPVPVPMGIKHRPVPHVELIDAITNEATKHQLVVAKRQFALGANGAALFGVMDLRPMNQQLALQTLGRNKLEAGLSIGFRSANDQSLAIRVVAGQRVFVCDNLALSGDMLALFRKHTTGLDVLAAVAMGFQKFLLQVADLTQQIAALDASPVTDSQAKVLIFDAFAANLVPSRLFDDVNRLYFHPADDAPDCQARTPWGIHNAFTRAIKQLTPQRAFEATVSIGRHFGLSKHQGVIDVDPINVQ